ncbi:hypothetical protein MLD38_038067 [Melastoma candidum]|nr:hypothetical protein MLD38_038067 [Melastoma candidum]
MNIVLEELTKKQTAEENGAEEFRKAMEEEIKFQKERNADLALQLKKTQESNVELLSVLQEFEETIDAQRVEINMLLSAKQIEGSNEDSRVSELEHEIREKEKLASRETAVLKLQIDQHREQIEVMALNYPLAYLDSALYALDISQNDQHESFNPNIELVKGKLEGAITLSEVNDTKEKYSLEEAEVGALKSRIQELEGRIDSFEVEKSSCKCLGGSQGEKTPVTIRGVDTYNNALEDRLSELEEENVWLSERIVGLEAQLRYLTNEKESVILSLQNSESLCSKLENDIRKLESDIEVMGIDTKQKLLAVRERLSESLDERGRLKVVNSKLQDDIEVLNGKSSFLEKANEDLKKENTELHEECAVLEAEVSELRELFHRVSTGIEVLEENFASLTEETALKEKALRSEVDALLRENERIHDNIPKESVQWSNMKATNGNVVPEHNEVVLMAEREKLLDLLEDIKSNEKQQKCTIRRFHIVLKGSEYENLRLVGEIKNLQLWLQQTELLRKEVSALRRGISEEIFEKERLEASNQVLLEQYEEMKSEWESLMRKVSSTQRALTEVEHSRNTKAALEERILRLEGDLTAREALFASDAQQRNELARMRITNGELQRRIKCLQDENHKYRTRIQQLGIPSESETLNKPNKDIVSVQNMGSIERELVDLRERYSAMSLKYAQAEAHREQLLMGSKATK